MITTIKQFQGPYRWLSNFWPCKIEHHWLEFDSVECAFQAAKCKHPEDRWQFSVESKLMVKARDESPEGPSKLAKKLGKKIELDPNWTELKVAIMCELLTQKFSRHHGLRDQLLATNQMVLIEGNTWHDLFWGVDLATGAGQNVLGRLLMAVRELYRI